MTTVIYKTPDPLEALSTSSGNSEDEWTTDAMLVSEAFRDAASLGDAIFSSSRGYDSMAGVDGGDLQVVYSSVDPWVTAFVAANANPFVEGIWNDSRVAEREISVPTPAAINSSLAKTDILSSAAGAGFAESPSQANTTATSVEVGGAMSKGHSAPQQIQSMSPGLAQTIYLTGDGSVWTMGSNILGQLGNGVAGSSAWSSTPVFVNLPAPMKQVGSGTALCWALSADGLSAYAWGDNEKGQLGIGDLSVAYSDVPMQIELDLPPDVSVVSMADGLQCTLALLSNGEVMAWGDNEFGQCGLDPSTAGLYVDKPTVIPGLTGVTSLAAGDFYSMALKGDGTVWAWGQNASGELGPNGPRLGKNSQTFVPVQVTGLPYIQKIVAGGRNGIALDASGHIWEWGRNEFGELGRGAVDQSPHPRPARVEGLPSIVSVDSEGPTVLAADARGRVYAWGFNKWGEVGNRRTTDVGSPQLVLTIPVAPGQPSVQVAAAHFSSYAFNVVTGKTYAWGKNKYGQIGIPANGGPNPFPINITGEILPTLPVPLTNHVPQHVENNVDGSHYTEVDGSHQVVQLSGADIAVDYSTNTRFVFHPGAGRELIYGFTDSGKGRDVLSLPNSDAGMLAEILMNATYDGSGTTLHLGHDDSIELVGVTKSELRAHPGDFAFHGPQSA